MRRLRQKLASIKLSPSGIAGLYCLLGTLWILATSYLVTPQSARETPTFQLELAKGFFYVIATSFLLCKLCGAFSKQIRKGQDRYRTYVAQSPIAIGVYNAEGEALDFNQAATPLTGYSREELLSLTIFDLDANSHPDVAKKVLARIFKEKRYTFDWQIFRKDGSRVIVEIEAVVDGKEALLFVQDRTQEKASEQRLKMLNAMLRAIRRVNQAIVNETENNNLTQKICEILVKDRGFNFAWIALFDEHTQELHHLSYAPASLNSRALRKLIKTGVFPSCLQTQARDDSLIVSIHPSEACPDLPICEDLQNDALICANLSCDNLTGHIALFASQTAATDDEELALFREVATDLNYALHSIMVENQKDQAMRDLQVATLKAEAANQAKSQFLSVMSHEMRTPLNPIIGHCELLLEDIHDPDIKESLTQIQNGAEQLLALVEQILYFINLQQEQLVSDQRAIKLLKSCEKILQDLLPHTAETTLRFINGEAHFSPIPNDLVIIADHTHLIQLLKNLLNNACKYTQQGEIIFSIGIESETEEHVVCIFQVKDTGIGIESDKLDDLFTAFTQGDYSYTRGYEGIGLGLATCKRIADLSGGSLHVESTEGKGSCFTYRCQFQRVSNEASPDKQLRDKQLQTKFNEDASSSQKHILVVEDNKENALVTERMLHRLHYKTTMVENGKIAITLSDKYYFDAILMDLSMPVMNGFEATQAIRHSSSKNRKTPIIALTAHADIESKKRSIQAGMDNYLRKPMNSNALKLVLEQHLQ